MGPKNSRVNTNVQDMGPNCQQNKAHVPHMEQTSQTKTNSGNSFKNKKTRMFGSRATNSKQQMFKIWTQQIKRQKTDDQDGLKELKKKHKCSGYGSPDMILTAFDVKFHSKKDEIPPRACNPSYAFIYSILRIRGPP